VLVQFQQALTAKKVLHQSVASVTLGYFWNVTCLGKEAWNQTKRDVILYIQNEIIPGRYFP